MIAKIKGGILLYAVFTSFMIAVFCSSIILLTYYLNYNEERFITVESLKDETEAVINFALVNPEQFSKGEEVPFFIFNENFHPKVKMNYWGAFKTLTVKAGTRTDSICKIALIGSFIKQEDKPALYLSEPGSNLSVCGNITIVGDCFIPKAFVKKVMIEGRNTEKIILPDKIISTTPHISGLNDSIFLPMQAEKFHSEEFQQITSFQRDTINNSFDAPTLFLYAPEDLVLTKKIIQGNVIIISSKEIIVKPDCFISDAILIAKKIRISASVNSKLQAYATDEIVVEDDVSLEYPSSLILIPGTNTSQNAVLKIGNSQIKGSLIVNDKNNRNSKLVTSEGSVIQGVIYSNNTVEFKGVLYGSLFCPRLSYMTKTASYKNLLMDAEINIPKLSKSFVDPCFFSNNQNLRIIKWLN